MKPLICFLSIFLILACRTEDEFGPIDDFYSLQFIGCECDPIEIIPFQQQWSLNFDNFEADIRVFGEIENGLILEEGIYLFEIIDTITYLQNPAELLRINGRSFWYSINESFLRISDIGADCDKGSSYSFNRN